MSKTLVMFGRIESGSMVELLIDTVLADCEHDNFFDAVECPVHGLVKSDVSNVAHEAGECDGCPVHEEGLMTDARIEEQSAVAWKRKETEPCEKGTVGCSVLHGRVGVSDICLPW